MMKKEAAALAKRRLATSPSKPAMQVSAPKESPITDPGTTLGEVNA